MKKVIITLVCAIILAGSTGLFVYYQTLPPVPVYYNLKTVREPITSNIADSEKHVIFVPYLKVIGKGHNRYLEKNESAIRSAILFTIRGKTEDELAGAVADALSVEILAELSKHIDVSFISEVSFSSFYIL